MTRKRFSLPPVTAKALRRQREILGALVRRALLAYAGFGTAMALLAVPMTRALESGSLLMVTLLGIGVSGIYALTGGALCGAFIDQLRHWPPPGPNCAINGGHFLRTWPWTAARILTQLGTRALMRGAS